MDHKVVRALVHPPPAEVGNKQRRMRRVDLGGLQTALVDTSVRFVLALVDHSGRIANRPLFADLGWRAGTTLVPWAGRGCIVLTKDEQGPLSLDSRERLAMTPALLRYCGIDRGDRVFLVAAPQHDLLVVHPMANPRR